MTLSHLQAEAISEEVRQKERKRVAAQKEIEKVVWREAKGKKKKSAQLSIDVSGK